MSEETGQVKFGTWVQAVEGVVYSDPPGNLKFSLDEKGKFWATFIDVDDGRKFPFESEVIQSILYMTLFKGKKHIPTKQDVEFYRRRCQFAAVQEFRQCPDREEVRLETNTLVMAVCERLHAWTHADDHAREEDRYELVRNAKALRAELVKVCDENDWGHDHWPKKHWFGPYLRENQEALKKENVLLGYKKRRGNIRPISLSWIDREKIPEWDGLVVTPE